MNLNEALMTLENAGFKCENTEGTSYVCFTYNNKNYSFSNLEDVKILAVTLNKEELSNVIFNWAKSDPCNTCEIIISKINTPEETAEFKNVIGEDITGTETAQKVVAYAANDNYIGFGGYEFNDIRTELKDQYGPDEDIEPMFDAQVKEKITQDLNII